MRRTGEKKKQHHFWRPIECHNPSSLFFMTLLVEKASERVSQAARTQDSERGVSQSQSESRGRESVWKGGGEWEI